MLPATICTRLASRFRRDGLGDLAGVAVGGVDDDDVDAGVHQAHRTLETGVADGRGRADQQPALVVLGGQGVSLGLLDVLDRDQADGAIGVVDDDQAFDLVLAQQLARLAGIDAFAHRDQVLAGHHRRGRDLVVALEAHVAVGQDADQLARAWRSTTGKPEILRRAVISRTSARVVSGLMVSGLMTMPLS
jgi:hypothetical protein